MARRRDPAAGGHTRCVNTFTSYKCECGQGWIKSADADTGDEVWLVMFFFYLLFYVFIYFIFCTLSGLPRRMDQERLRKHGRRGAGALRLVVLYFIFYLLFCRLSTLCGLTRRV